MEPTSLSLSENRSKLTVPRDAEKAPFPGVAPKLMVTQVFQTAPFLFDSELELSDNADYLRELRRFFFQKDQMIGHPYNDALSYFRFCLACHFSTTGAFVPVDVDNTIRLKIWENIRGEDQSVTESLAKVALEAFSWNFSAVTRRYYKPQSSHSIVSFHQGSWFAVAAGAYAASKLRRLSISHDILNAIVSEIHRENNVYAESIKNRDGLTLVQGAATISHNLGDLDRVIDMWNIDDADPIREFYGLGTECKDKQFQPLKIAGDLNKAYVSHENHRHLTLRRPRGLRRFHEFLLPVAPFWDTWGKAVGQHPELSEVELGVIIEGLIDGWTKMKSTAYARALSGIEESMSGGLEAMCKLIPKSNAKDLRSGSLRFNIDIAEKRYEQMWYNRAIQFIAKSK